MLLVEGKSIIIANDVDFCTMGARMNVFEPTPPHALYVPNKSHWQTTATIECTLALCLASGKGNYPMARLGGDGVKTLPRGRGVNRHYINNIAMQTAPCCG